MPHILLQNISKSFDKTRILDSLSLEIKEKELFFLLGSSGSGKSTLLRIIAGLERPDSGSILFNQRDVTHLDPAKRKIAMVFQQYALWPHMTVFQNVCFGLEIAGFSKAKQKKKVQAALEAVRMEEFTQRYPGSLSGGQQQRVSLARALALEPEILLLDEPLSSLDTGLRVEIREQIKELHSKLGFTGIYVTHDQEEALSLASRIALLGKGKILQVGKPKELCKKPALLEVARFVGHTNIFRFVGKEGTLNFLPSDPAQPPLVLPIAPPFNTGFCIIPQDSMRLRPGTDFIRLKGRLKSNSYLGSYEMLEIDLGFGFIVSMMSVGDSIPVKRGEIFDFSLDSKSFIFLENEISPGESASGVRQ